jgi:hypothetical protein
MPVVQNRPADGRTWLPKRVRTDHAAGNNRPEPDVQRRSTNWMKSGMECKTEVETRGHLTAKPEELDAS